MAKYGSPHVGWLLVDGFNLLGSEVMEAAVPDPEAITEETDGLGKSWVEHAATGLRKATASLEALYDDATDAIVDALTELEQVERIVCWNLTGNAAGAKFVGAAGTFGAKYRRLFRRGGLHRIALDQVISGAVDEGIVLSPLETRTAAWNTEATSVDHGAATSNGGVAYQQIEAFTGFSAFVGKVRHSADDAIYADLVAFDDQTARGAQRKLVAGTVNRHLAFDGAPTGTGELRHMGGFSRG